MRQKLIEELCKAARADDRIVLLTADLGFGVLEQFANEFPDRYFNVGVAEQSLIAAATGLAEAGFVPFCYSIATFASLRGVEYIRNGSLCKNTLFFNCKKLNTYQVKVFLCTSFSLV